jgi:cation:H+ antiporter
MDILIFIVAMAVLIYGADVVIRQSEKIALHFNISEFVIGATLIAIGTSLPEMAASISASFQGKADMAISNVIGSNILNITLILGLTFLIASKIKPDRDLFENDSAWLILPMLVFLLTIYDGVVSRFDGMLLAFVMVAYIIYLRTNSDKANIEPIDEALKKEPFQWTKTTLWLLAGFVCVVGGADFAVASGSNIAYSFGVSEWIVGLVLISFGTSLPELVVSIVAAKKDKADMAIGNIIGSNLANVAVAIAAAAAVAPIGIDIFKNMFDILVLVVATFTLVFITANRFYNKAAGIILLIVFMLFMQNVAASL